MELPLKIKFDGEDADEHRLPAFDAAESLDGIAKSILIPTNYLVEGRVRYKNFTYDDYRIDLISVRPGSLDVLFNIHLNLDALKDLHELGIAVTGAFVYDFIKSVIGRAIGKSAPKAIERLEEQNLLKTGDMGALVDAIEAPVKRAHTVINRGAKKIAIIDGDSSPINLNAASKLYVQTTEINSEVRSKVVSVPSITLIQDTEEFSIWKKVRPFLSIFRPAWT